MKTSAKLLVLSAIASSALAFSASAAVIGVNIGTGLPPATLGGYSMSSFDPGTIGGSIGYAHETGGSDDGTGTTGWATWGQSYTGRVYVCLSSSALTLNLSGQAEAVYFYEEPNQFSDFSMTATDSSGTSVTTVINGYHGSGGIGFYESTAGGPYLTKISVTCADPTGFAVGEFGINGGTLTGGTGGGSVPDGGATCMLLGLASAGLAAVRRFIKA